MIDFTPAGEPMVRFKIVGAPGRQIELSLSSFLALTKAAKTLEELRREIFLIATEVGEISKGAHA